MREPKLPDTSHALSLRSQLLRRLLIPLVTLFCFGAAASYYIALGFANSAYDRALYDSARSLAQQIKVVDGRTVVDLPRAALEMFEWDDLDTTYYRISSESEGFVFGHKAMPDAPPPPKDSQRAQYFDGDMLQQKVRVVALQLPAGPNGAPVKVQVAETRNKRSQLVHDILLTLVLPQLMIIAMAGVLVWFGVTTGLVSLRLIEREIATRTHRDLSPLPDRRVPTEVLPLTHAINDLMQRLGQTLSVQHRFISDAAHQLRTPIAGLKVQIERALLSKDMDEIRPALAQLQTSAERVAHLSNQLLTLARAEPGASDQTRFTDLDLNAIARETGMQWVPRALERNIDLGFAGSDVPVPIRGDGLLLQELISNLIDNAVRYGRDGGSITISVAARPQPQFTIEDDGPGIPEHERDRVFERFHRLPDSPGGGSGLGLAIVREIAQAHGATVALDTPDSGGGTRIRITFAGA
jgi:two-component system sensor histidine kinase TctE